MKTVSFDEDVWQLVPKEPTEAMSSDGWCDAIEHEADNIDIYDIAAIYRSMLAAAPQPPVVEVEPVAFCRVEDVFDNDSMLTQLGTKRGALLYLANPDTEALRQRVKELEAEVETEKKRNAPLRMLVQSLEEQKTIWNKGRDKVREANGTLDSEREANALLTAQLATQAEQIKTAIDAMQKAADVFEFYARHHATKNPIDDAKAVRNYAHRNDLRIAIAKLEVK